MISALSQMSLTGFGAGNAAPADHHQAASEPSKSAAGTRELCTLRREAKWGGGDGTPGGGEARANTPALVQKRALS